MAAPVDGTEYPVVIGKSLFYSPADAVDDTVHTTFRYEFQPASVDEATPGVVTVAPSNGVQVLMGSSSASGSSGGVLFKGKAVENKDTECVLLFDGEQFVLERIPYSCTQLRHARAPPKKPTKRVGSQGPTPMRSSTRSVGKKKSSSEQSSTQTRVSTKSD